VVLVLVVTVL